MRMKKKICCTISVLACIFLTAGCSAKFDASGYTEAVLALQFQGDATQAMGYVDGVKKSSLLEIYQQFIDHFVSGYVTEGMDVPESQAQEFGEITARIFSIMRYEVGEAKRTGKKEYEVPVIIEPADTFLRYQDLLQEDAVKITNRIKEGKYEGDEESLQAQVMQEILESSTVLLAEAADGTEYGEKQTVILHVSAGKDGEYAIDSGDMDQLIRKILRLDEIGD